jgi:hypothetical protein
MRILELTKKIASEDKEFVGVAGIFSGGIRDSSQGVTGYFIWNHLNFEGAKTNE